MRSIKGHYGGPNYGIGSWYGDGASTSGAIYKQTLSEGYASAANSQLSSRDRSFHFDNGRVVEIGPENSPRTMSELVWRRVA